MADSDDSGDGADYDRRPVAERMMDGLVRRKALLAANQLDLLEGTFRPAVLAEDIRTFDLTTREPLAVPETELKALALRYKTSLMCLMARLGMLEMLDQLLTAGWWKLQPRDWPMDAMAFGACAEGQVDFLQKVAMGWTFTGVHLHVAARNGHFSMLYWLLQRQVFATDELQKALQGAAFAGYGDCVNLLIDMQGTRTTPELLAAVRRFAEDKHLALGGRARDWNAVLFYLDGK